MWRQVTLPLSELDDLEALEKKLGGHVVNVHLLDEDTARVEYAPVVDDSWFLEIWNREARVCYINEFDFILYVDDIYEVDEAARQRVIQQVMEDYGITLEDTGQYYPISSAAQEAFQAMMKTARRKRPVSRSHA
ncbi:MAG: hypothetical protein GXO55_08915 [Chloroflexi bacterium]|nr:hypothetical protein [Chloroflexota bacterium]